MNRNHTHTGNCQACGREHAIDIVHGDMAKHGYTVDWGSFNGVCPGSDCKPAQVSVDFTHVIIKQCMERAHELTQHAQALEEGSVDPDTVIQWHPTLEWTSEYGRKRVGKNVNVPYKLGTLEECKRARSAAIHSDRQNAASNVSHATFLHHTVVPMLGTQLMSVEQAETRKAELKAAKGPTKQSFKDRLEKVSRDYDKVRQVIHKALLALDRDTRNEAWEDAYDMPYSLAHFRPKHAKAVLEVLPSVGEQLNEIAGMIECREAIKREQKEAGKG